MTISTDTALQLARRGDQRGFSALFVELSGPITRFAHARGAEDPEGLTNEVFLAAFNRLDRFAGGADDFRGWVFTIARNKTIDDARRRARRPDTGGLDGVVEPGASDVSQDVIELLEAEWVSETLAALTDEQREVIVLRVVGDLTIAEIARIIDKPIGAVKALQRRGLRRLQKEISDGPYPFEADRR